MDDFRLKVFVSVAHNRSFTKASKELFISQPAISKHIRELENQYSTPLFDRTGSVIRLTKAGEVMLMHAQKILDGYRRMQYDLNLLTDNFSGELRLGASTTIAQYIMPPYLARFMASYPNIHTSLITGNTEQIEQALIEKSIDLALVEGEIQRSGIRYEPFMRDELVLVTATRSSHARLSAVTVDELMTLPIVLREVGSGTLDVIERRLADRKLRLSSFNILMHLGSTESIKAFLLNYDAVAIISIRAITHELLSDTLKVIDIDGMTFEREFAFATVQGASLAAVAKFEAFAKQE